MPEDDAPERAGEKSHRIGREGGHRARHLVQVREKEAVEDQGRSRAVEKEVVPFDRRADETGEHDPGGSRLRWKGRGGGGHAPRGWQTGPSPVKDKPRRISGSPAPRKGCEKSVGNRRRPITVHLFKRPCFTIKATTRHATREISSIPVRPSFRIAVKVPSSPLPSPFRKRLGRKRRIHRRRPRRLRSGSHRKCLGVRRNRRRGRSRALAEGRVRRMDPTARLWPSRFRLRLGNLRSRSRTPHPGVFAMRPMQWRSYVRQYEAFA